jgi:hypothetical protein
MGKEKDDYSSGISTFSLLGVAFIILKLCGVINWSWWYVTLPFWGGAALILGIVLIVFILAALKN